MIKVRLKVTGRVQGVAFRYMTKAVADQLGVYGIVRNEMDGSVYIEANGSPKKIEKFIAEVRKSPTPSGRVDGLSVEYDEEIKVRHKFRITN